MKSSFQDDFKTTCQIQRCCREHMTIVNRNGLPSFLRFHILPVTFFLRKSKGIKEKFEWECLLRSLVRTVSLCNIRLQFRIWVVDRDDTEYYICIWETHRTKDLKILYWVSTTEGKTLRESTPPGFSGTRSVRNVPKIRTLGSVWIERGLHNHVRLGGRKDLGMSQWMG